MEHLSDIQIMRLYRKAYNRMFEKVFGYSAGMFGVDFTTLNYCSESWANTIFSLIKEKIRREMDRGYKYPPIYKRLLAIPSRIEILD